MRERDAPVGGNLDEARLLGRGQLRWIGEPYVRSPVAAARSSASRVEAGSAWIRARISASTSAGTGSGEMPGSPLSRRAISRA